MIPNPNQQRLIAVTGTGNERERDGSLNEFHRQQTATDLEPEGEAFPLHGQPRIEAQYLALITHSGETADQD